MPHPTIEPANALHLQTHPPSQSGHGHPDRTPRVSFTAGSVHIRPDSPRPIDPVTPQASHRSFMA
jgi:hypothetical protein